MTDRACFGCCCPQHAQCEHWNAVEGHDPDAPCMLTCGELHPMFRPCQQARVQQQALEAARPQDEE